jgi:hypothetical protein
MSHVITACLHCSREFFATHGNREYCPETNCQKAKKAAVQKKYYEVYKAMLGGYVGNYRLFEDTLGNAQSKTIAFHEFEIAGFDQNGFYGSLKDEAQKEWYIVKDYVFHLFLHPSDNQAYITIKKLPS